MQFSERVVASFALLVLVLDLVDCLPSSEEGQKLSRGHRGRLLESIHVQIASSFPLRARDVAQSSRQTPYRTTNRLLRDQQFSGGEASAVETGGLVRCAADVEVVGEHAGCCVIRHYEDVGKAVRGAVAMGSPR